MFSLKGISSSLASLSSSSVKSFASPFSLPTLLSNLQQCFYRKTTHKQLRQTIEKGLVYAYRDRRRRVRFNRELAILRVNTAPIRYSELRAKLKVAKIGLNVKSLERLFIGEPETTAALVKALDSLKPQKAPRIPKAAKEKE